MSKKSKSNICRLGLRLKDLVDFLCIFIIPPFLQPLMKILMRKTNHLNRLYSLLSHKDKTVSILSSSSSNASVLYKGDMFLESYISEKFCTMGMKNFKKTGFKPDAGEKIDILKINRLTHKYFRQKGYIIVPDWVRAVLESDGCDFQKLFNRSSKRSVKKLEEFEFSYKVINAADMLDKFYYEFYEPYIQTTYGESGLFKEYSHLKLFARKSSIITIIWDNQITASVYVFPEKDVCLKIYAAGIRGGFDKKIRELSQDAIYYFSTKVAEDLSFQRIDFGLNRAFLTDGVLNYKRKWGCRFGIHEEGVYDIAINPCSDIIKSFLEQNPILFFDDDFISCFFYYRKRIPSLKEILGLEKIWQDCGAQKIYIISHLGFDFEPDEIEKSHPNLKLIKGDVDNFSQLRDDFLK